MSNQFRDILSKVKNTNGREKRDIAIQNLEVREVSEGDNGDKYYHVSGKAVCFNERTKLWGDGESAIYEIMEPTCFDGADISDVVLNVNHGDGNHAVARTRNNTLSLDIREDGVYISARLSKENERCVQVYRDVSEGLLDKMSFAFTIAEDEFNEEERCFHVRKVNKCYDVSFVEHPAYDGTSCSAERSADLEKLAVELENRAKRAEKELNKRKEALHDKIAKALSIGE